jgi:CSLREA domain-containing protein
LFVYQFEYPFGKTAVTVFLTRRNKMKIISRLLIVSLITLCFTLSAFAATFVVNTTSDTADVTPGNGACADASANCSLRAAISEANALGGDHIITLPAGTYTQTLVAANEDLNAGGDWDIRSRVTINGAGAATTIIQAAATPGTATERVLHAVGGSGIPALMLNNVTVRHGNQVGTGPTDRGGGISSLGRLTVDNSVITLNSSSSGGGIFVEGLTALTGVTVSGNSCISSGTSCTGGGLRKNVGGSDPNLTLTNCLFLNNTATAAGTDATAFGAGLWIGGGGFTVNISGTLFSGNQGTGTGAGGSIGGGAYLETISGTANITNSAFINNSGSGGTTVKGTAIAAKSVGVGGAFNGTWDKLTVDGNTGGSAVLFENDGAVGMAFNARNSTISNNTGAAEGGGVLINTVSGAIILGVTVNFLNTTISGNTASSSGGGVMVKQPSPQVNSMTTANFNYCTIAGNTGGSTGGGGIFQAAGSVNLKNSIVADNTGTTGPDISGSVNSQDYNHIEDLTGATITGTTTHNATGAPNLGPLQVNGSGPKTQLPNAGSPVINTIPNGTNDCGTTVTTDERGVTRPQGGLCEKGAAEVEVPFGPWDLSGTVKTSDGRPVRNTAVTLSGGGLPAPVTVYTGMLGTYLFADLPGATYTLSVQGKKFTFATPSQVVNLSSDVTTADFIANEEIGVRPAPVVKDMEKKF